jgi:hypothetical protein
MSLTTYFAAIGYKHKYDIGDRVIGKFNKIPFVGSVGNDRLVSTETGPEVTIHLDLPLLFDKIYHTIIVVKHKDIRRLHEIHPGESNTRKVIGDNSKTGGNVRRKSSKSGT